MQLTENLIYGALNSTILFRKVMKKIKQVQTMPRKNTMSLILGCFFTFIVGALAVWFAMTQSQEKKFAQLERSAMQVAQEIDMSMYQRFQEVEQLSKNAEITNPTVANDTKRIALEKIQNEHPEYAWIGLTNTKGIVQASVRSMLEKQDVSARPWYQGAQEKTFVGDVHEALLLAKLLPNVTGEPLRFVDISTPVFGDNNEKVGILGAHLSWTWIRDIEAKVLQSQENESLEAFILAQDGTVLAGPQNLQGQKLQLSLLTKTQDMNVASAQETWNDNNKYLTAYAKTQGYKEYPGLGWIILVRKPVQ